MKSSANFQNTLAVLSLQLIILSFIVLSSNHVHGGNVLFVSPVSSKSENQFFVPLLKELALKGHSVTFVGSIKPNLNLKNFREINPVQPLLIEQFDPSFTNALHGRRYAREHPIQWFLTFDFSFISDLCIETYENKEFQSIYNEEYDVVILSGGLNNCFSGLVHKFKAPLVFMTSFPSTPMVSALTGLRTPSSFVPNPMMPFTDKMTFSERMVSFLLDSLFELMYYTAMPADNDKIFRKYLGQDTPSMLDIERNISLILSNSHVAVTPIRPVMPDLVEVGGLHLRPPKPLPKDLEDFISGAKDGCIFFSLGSVVTGASLPEETRKMFSNVFSRLKQRVLWKWDNETMPDLPANVKLGTWLPQQDILGHKNIKLFMSHSGLFSTEESAYHGVPMLSIPIFADQDVNARMAQDKGFGTMVEILDLTEEKLEATIKNMLTDKKYAKKAADLSELFKNQPVSSLQLAVHWVEYVIKHKGAPALRSSARDLSLFVYHSYDVKLTLLGAFSLVLFVLYKVLSFCCCRGKTLKKQKIN